MEVMKRVLTIMDFSSGTPCATGKRNAEINMKSRWPITYPSTFPCQQDFQLFAFSRLAFPKKTFPQSLIPIMKAASMTLN